MPKSAIALASLLIGLVLAGTSPPVAMAAGGVWSVRPSPNVGPPTADDILSSVSCVSATFCATAGDYANSGHGYPTLFERWDGHKWSVMPGPTLGSASTDSFASGVSCVSTRSCMVVGMTGDHGLAEHWDGTKWSVVPVPGSEVDLNGVDCTGPEACVAVGDQTSKTENSRSLIETWDGTKWSIVASPNPGPAAQYAYSAGPAHDILESVSCPSPTWCAALGVYITPAGVTKTLAEQWDGKTWSIEPSADKPSATTAFMAVSCTSARSCVAVGDFESTGYDTLTESWDGAKWSIVASPDKGPVDLDDDLAAVSCLSPQSCVAVGAAAESPAGGRGETLVESWNGAAWSLVPSPDKGPVSGLSGVSCAPSAPCVAVGSYLIAHHGGTLTEVS